jgi:hypothetical protein
MSLDTRTRKALLDSAPALIAGARAATADPGALEAADQADKALARLQEIASERADAGSLRAEQVAAALAQEAGLDRRVRGLADVIGGFAALGAPGADELGALLFPTGAAEVTRPKGRAQRGEYLDLAQRLGAHAGHPAAAAVAAHFGPLEADLRAFCAVLDDKQAAHGSVGATAQAAAEAAADLRAALRRLALVMAVALGGDDTLAYRRWRAPLG